METPRRLVGGQAGERRAEQPHPFVQAGVKAMDLTGQNLCLGRFLPAFDDNLRGQPDFITSFVPYRDVTRLGRDGHLEFTKWFYVVLGHKFVGLNQRAFLSPFLRSGGHRGRGVDPLYDIHEFVTKTHDEKWKPLLARRGGRPPLLQKVREFAAANALVVNQRTGGSETRILFYPVTCLDWLLAELNSRAPWGGGGPSKYLLGDITDPMEALKFRVIKGFSNQQGKPPVVFQFREFASGSSERERAPFDPFSERGRQILASRYDLADLETVLRVPDGDEILHYLVERSEIPYRLIQEACGKDWLVPREDARVVRTTFPAINLNSAPPLNIK